MRRAFLLAMLLLAAPLLTGGADAGASCDYNFREEAGLGSTYVRSTTHRCTWSENGTTYTQRLERYDVFLYDPYSASGTGSATSFFLESSLTRYPDGSSNSTHRTYLGKDGLSFELSYTSSEDSEGRSRCAAMLGHKRPPSGGAEVRSPLLPYCAPTDLLLP